MSCRICKRGACTESFHSLEEQERCTCPSGSGRDEKCPLHGEEETTYEVFHHGIDEDG